MIMKFRVWCKNKNEWEKSDVLLTQDGKLIDYNNRIQSQENHVICPFTGELDSTGKEIYEGDILERKGVNVPLAAKWDSRTRSFGLDKGNNESTFIWFHSPYTIIGNIYENPELLKEFWDKIKD